MKGIILAAGYGSRFLPITKTVAKEMLPLVDRPAIDFIVEEFSRSGIKDIFIVTSRRKKALEDYYDRAPELEEVFRRNGKTKALEQIMPPSDLNIAFIRQKEMLGSGSALLAVAPFLGGEPAVVAYPDDLVFGKIPLTQQLMQEYEKSGKTVLATLENPENINAYGVLSFHDDGSVASIVEKPAVGAEPSRQASIGRYLYTPDFFDYLKEESGRFFSGSHEGEFYHTPALNRQMADKSVTAVAAVGERFDLGSPKGFLKATLYYAKMRGFEV